MTDEQIYRAAEAAIRDSKAARGGYYNGPATEVYLAVRAAIQAAMGYGDASEASTVTTEIRCAECGDLKWPPEPRP